MSGSLSAHQASQGKTKMVRTFMSRKTAISHKSNSISLTMLAFLLAGLVAASGCGSDASPSRLQVGPIAFTDANGAPQTTRKVLTAGESAYMDVTLTNDPENLGADWSVYCGSAPPPGTPLPPGQTQDQSCGTFIPVHTMSGPIPGYVTNPSGYVTLFTAPAAPPKSGTITLYATATTDHSHLSTTTLIVDPQSISIAFEPLPPSTVVLGSSTQLTAVVNNDPTNSGVIWKVTCQLSDCGSFNPTTTASGVATTYTAPGGTGAVQVQITAASVADPNKAVSYNISAQPASSSVMRPEQPAGDMRSGTHAYTSSTGAVDRNKERISRS